MISSFKEFQAVSKDSKPSVSSIWIAFRAEPEYDKYGIANAVTRAAQSEENWEKSLENWRKACHSSPRGVQKAG